MKAELLSLDQSMSLRSGQTTTWVTFQLPGGHTFRAMVADDEAAALANIVATGGDHEEELEAPPHPQAHLPPPSFPAAQPAYRPQAEAPSPPTGSTRVVWHDDGAPIHAFGGEDAPAPPIPAWQPPSAVAPAAHTPTDPKQKVWRDPIAQMKAQKRGEIQSPPARTVSMDEKGNPVVRVDGGVDVNAQVRTSDAPGDDDGVGSV